MSEINILRDLKQISTENNKKHAEFHIYPLGNTGYSNKGFCKSLRAKKYAGIKLPELTGMKADKGSAEVGTMQHEVTQKKMRKKYAKHTKVKFIDEVFTILQIVPPTKHEITVETERSVKFPKGTKLKNLGMTGISPVDMEFYLLKDGFDSAIEMKEIEFANCKAEVPILNLNKAVIIEDYDIKSVSDFAYYKMRKEGLPWRYQAQGHCYMKANIQKFILFLIIHKQSNLKYIIKLDYSDESWERVVDDQSRVLFLAYQILTHDECDEEWEDFECLEKNIGWWWCPLSKVEETTNAKTKKTRMSVLSFCPEAQKLLVEKKEYFFPIGSIWKYKSGFAYILTHDFDKKNQVESVVYCTKTEWTKKEAGKSYKFKEVPLALAYQNFKEVDLADPVFPNGQTLIDFHKDPEIDMCTDCGCFVDGKCENYGVFPASYPERPEWCFFPIPKEVK